MVSDLSYEEYAMWARSRFPGLSDRSEEPLASRPTMLADCMDPCPVTVRSFHDQAVVTPRPKGSQ